MKQIFSLPTAAAEKLNHHTATTRPASLIFCSSLPLTYQRTSTNASERQRTSANVSGVGVHCRSLVFTVVRFLGLATMVICGGLGHFAEQRAQVVWFDDTEVIAERYEPTCVPVPSAGFNCKG